MIIGSAGVYSFAADYSSELGLKIYAEYLYAKSFENTVTIAVIDSGVANIERLNERIIAGYDFQDNDADPSNDISSDSHGTFIASVIAAATEDLPINIMPVRILENKDVSVDNLVKGIKYAVDNGADILNISIGGEVTDCSEIDEAIAYADEHGVTVVVAAGNAKKEIITYCPAHNESVITVSSITGSKIRASYSNYGEAVDCCAPGDNVDGYNANGEKAAANGTSFSAAYISAGAAMIKLEHPEYNAQEIQQVIKSVCIDLGEEGKDKYYGYGLPDFKRLIPSSVNIKNYAETITVPYKSTVILYAETNLPFEPDIKWYVNGEYYMSGNRFDIENIADDISVYFEATDESGYALRSATETVKVSSGFFARLIAFFKQIFGLLPVISQSVFSADFTVSLIEGNGCCN